jgi:hypothetical protein
LDIVKIRPLRVAAVFGHCAWLRRFATMRGGLFSPETVPFMPLRVAATFRQKPFRLCHYAWRRRLARNRSVYATARGGDVWPETVPTGFRHLPAGRRFALHP